MRFLILVLFFAFNLNLSAQTAASDDYDDLYTIEVMPETESTPDTNTSNDEEFEESFEDSYTPDSDAFYEEDYVRDDYDPYYEQNYELEEEIARANRRAINFHIFADITIVVIEILDAILGGGNGSSFGGSDASSGSSGSSGMRGNSRH